MGRPTDAGGFWVSWYFGILAWGSPDRALRERSGGGCPPVGLEWVGRLSSELWTEPRMVRAPLAELWPLLLPREGREWVELVEMETAGCGRGVPQLLS